MITNCPICGERFSQLDYDSGDYTERGFCENCESWFDTQSGEKEVTNCVKCGKPSDNLTNFLCDECWDERYIKTIDGIPVLDDSKLEEVKKQ